MLVTSTRTAQQKKNSFGSPTKRREMDLMKLMMSDYEVTTTGDSASEFWVKFHGPKSTPYEGGVWQVHVELPETYPYKSPSIGFANCIFHPNVDFVSGTVCLDVINQTWSPMYDLCNVFEVFLPQLLSYPNPTDPLNGDAAGLLLKDPKKFAERVKDCMLKYAKPEDASKIVRNAEISNSKSQSLSSEDPSEDMDMDEEVEELEL